jgi:hypothetical protein
MDTKVGRVKDLLWKVKRLEPRGLSQQLAMDSVGQYRGSHLTWLSSTWTFDTTWVASVVHLFFLIAFALLLPRADQLEHQTQAIPSQMVTDISLIMEAAMDTSLEILAVLFHTMAGAQLVPLIGKALQQKRF